MSARREGTRQGDEEDAERGEEPRCKSASHEPKGTTREKELTRLGVVAVGRLLTGGITGAATTDFFFFAPFATPARPWTTELRAARREEKLGATRLLPVDVVQREAAAPVEVQ